VPFLSDGFFENNVNLTVLERAYDAATVAAGVAVAVAVAAAAAADEGCKLRGSLWKIIISIKKR
jgi:hypothetical protein